MRKIILKETQIKSLIKILNEQDEEYYYITPQELIDILELGSYSSAVLKPKNFEGKNLYVQGKLDLGGKPIKSLGNIAYVDGDLNIQNTKISTLGSTKVRGYVWDMGSTMYDIRIRKEELGKIAVADERRQDGEWDLDNPKIDDEGLAANALFQWLVNNNDLDEMDEETKTLLQSKIERLKELQERYEDVEGTLEPDEVSPLYDEISDLETEIEELQDNYADVYYIMPQSYRSYDDLNNFEVIGLKGQEYIVGYWDDMYEAAVENQEQLIDDVGIEGLPDWLVESNIDEDQIKYEIRDYYEDDIRENPDVYFDEDDYELTTEQEERKEQLENYINEMEDLKTEKEEELENTEDEDERADLESEIEEIEDNIEKAQDELDNIEPDTEPSEEMIEEKVEYYVRRTDPIDWLKELGRDLKEYVDIKGIAKDIVDSDGLGVMNSYDGNYDEETVTTPDGKRYTFVIMRMN